MYLRYLFYYSSISKSENPALAQYFCLVANNRAVKVVLHLIVYENVLQKHCFPASKLNNNFLIHSFIFCCFIQQRIAGGWGGVPTPTDVRVHPGQIANASHMLPFTPMRNL